MMGKKSFFFPFFCKVFHYGNIGLLSGEDSFFFSYYPILKSKTKKPSVMKLNMLLTR